METGRRGEIVLREGLSRTRFPRLAAGQADGMVWWRWGWRLRALRGASWGIRVGAKRPGHAPLLTFSTGTFTQLGEPKPAFLAILTRFVQIYNVFERGAQCAYPLN
jgi:hypothetical protein